MLLNQHTIDKMEPSLLQRSNMFIATLWTDISAPAERHVISDT